MHEGKLPLLVHERRFGPDPTEGAEYVRLEQGVYPDVTSPLWISIWSVGAATVDDLRVMRDAMSEALSALGTT